MITAREATKVFIQDIIIIGAFLILSCFASKSSALVGESIATAFFVFLIPVGFLILFYSNGGLFKKLSNIYAWSMGSGMLSLVLFIPTIMYAVHNAC